jgi:hypothetical protein
VEWLSAALRKTVTAGFLKRNFQRWPGATYHRKTTGFVHKNNRILR